MKFYVLACFEMVPDGRHLKDLIDWLTPGLKRFAKEGLFLNVTSSDLSFLNDARRLAKGDPPPTFNPSFSNRHSKKSSK